MYFEDRKEAGKLLAKEVVKKYHGKNIIVFGLPRGGIIPAAEVAHLLHAPLYIIISRKIGHPLDPEYALAALSQGGHFIQNDDKTTVTKRWLGQEIEKARQEIDRIKFTYGAKEIPSLKGKIALLVDDGIATGLTMRAAIADLKDLHPIKIVIATPVIQYSVADKLQKEVNEIVSLDMPLEIDGVGLYYHYFPQMTDEEVISYLRNK